LIVGITTRADAKETQEFLAAGSNYCFEKPLDRAKVEQVLQDHPNFTTWFTFSMWIVFAV